MDKLARGRIWPGDEALKNGLVDRNGGYATSFILIRELARLPSQMPITLVEFPKAKGAVEYLLEMARSGHVPDGLTGTFASIATLNRLATDLRPLTDAIDSRQESLKMPPVQTR